MPARSSKNQPQDVKSRKACRSNSRSSRARGSSTSVSESRARPCPGQPTGPRRRAAPSDSKTRWISEANHSRASRRPFLHSCWVSLDGSILQPQSDRHRSIPWAQLQEDCSTSSTSCSGGFRERKEEKFSTWTPNSFRRFWMTAARAISPNRWWWP